MVLDFWIYFVKKLNCAGKVSRFSLLIESSEDNLLWFFWHNKIQTERVFSESNNLNTLNLNPSFALISIGVAYSIFFNGCRSSDGQAVSSKVCFIYILDSSKSKAKLLQLKLIHIFARAILLMKKLEIEKTNPTFIISVFKVEY